jgi:hypothetical protein
MTKLLLCFAGCFILNFSFAQSVVPEVVSTSGTSYNNGSSQIDWTLGETVTSTYTGSDMLTQGFHQPNLTITSLNDSETECSVAIFPNPSTDFVQLQFKDPKEIFVVELFTVDGKLLESKQTSSALKLDMMNYKAGTYLLSVKNKSAKSKSFRIVKS